MSGAPCIPDRPLAFHQTFAPFDFNTDRVGVGNAIDLGVWGQRGGSKVEEG